MGVVLVSEVEQFIDVIDVTDPDLEQTEAAERSNCDPILLRKGAGDGVEQMVRQILRRLRAKRKPIGSLAIHGHGLPGVQSLAGGVPRAVTSLAAALQSITPKSRDVLAVQNLDAIAPTLRMLSGQFRGTGRVSLMGCYVGNGLEGRQLVNALARIWRVPVTAGIGRQRGGGLYTGSIEGPSVTGWP